MQIQLPLFALLLTAIYSFYLFLQHIYMLDIWYLHWSWQHTKALGAESAETIGSFDSQAQHFRVLVLCVGPFFFSSPRVLGYPSATTVHFRVPSGPSRTECDKKFMEAPLWFVVSGRLPHKQHDVTLAHHAKKHNVLLSALFVVMSSYMVWSPHKFNCSGNMSWGNSPVNTCMEPDEDLSFDSLWNP